MTSLSEDGGHLPIIGYAAADGHSRLGAEIPCVEERIVTRISGGNCRHGPFDLLDHLIEPLGVVHGHFGQRLAVQ